jgi:hypothetical protein
MPERIFLMFDYNYSGLWHAEGDRPAGMVDVDELPLTGPTKERLAAWVQQCDDLNMQAIQTGRQNAAGWERAHQEALALWRLIREEAGPRWIVGVRDTDGIAWDEADLGA